MAVEVQIDGRKVEVAEGSMVMDAAAKLDIYVPHFCYHKKLSIAANCRMCLVEMSNAPGGKLMPSCQVPLSEGVAVKTDTPKVKDQQRATLEFLLLNHPVDCSICDQAGECKLQDYYMQYDAQPSRLDIPKNVKGKRVELGPTVTLDQGIGDVTGTTSRSVSPATTGRQPILCSRMIRAARERIKAKVSKDWGFAPGYNDLLAKVVAVALRQFPYMNARLAPDAEFAGAGRAGQRRGRSPGA